MTGKNVMPMKSQTTSPGNHFSMIKYFNVLQKQIRKMILQKEEKIFYIKITLYI